MRWRRKRKQQDWDQALEISHQMLDDATAHFKAWQHQQTREIEERDEALRKAAAREAWLSEDEIPL